MRLFAQCILLVTFFCVGCMHRGTVPMPTATPSQPPKPDLSQHLLGTWEQSGRGKIKQVIFEPNGQLSFRGGLDFLNGGHWLLDPVHQELKMSFPNASDRNLDIFHMYVGQGVKSFDRINKEVTYQFNDQTWSLNIAGWPYSKVEETTQPALPEPVFK